MKRAFETRKGKKDGRRGVLLKDVSLAWTCCCRGRASGRRQPSVGRDNLMNAPPFTRRCRHPFITTSLVLLLYSCLLDEVRLLEFAPVLYSRRLVCVTVGPGEKSVLPPSSIPLAASLQHVRPFLAGPRVAAVSKM